MSVAKPKPTPTFEQGVLQRLNAIDYALRKIRHDHVQILIWIANTRKRLLDAGVYNDVGEYTRTEPQRFADGAPTFALPRAQKKKPAAGNKGK